jgi:hypothetical protein
VKAEGFQPIEAPNGKLSARNDAHSHAASDGADVIVTWDADAHAHHDGVLAALIEPFREPEVVAVRGEPASAPGPFGICENVMRRAMRATFDHLHGQLSAFTADAWRSAGPFDTDLDQSAIQEVWAEEEVRFAQRLRAVGELRHAPQALVHNDSRRNMCRLRRGMGTARSDWCTSRGEATFAPRDR